MTTLETVSQAQITKSIPSALWAWKAVANALAIFVPLFCTFQGRSYPPAGR